MSNYPTLAAMTAAQRKEYEDAVSAWLNNPEDTSVGLSLLTALPQAKIFLGYAKCYSVDAKRKEIEKLLAKYATPTPAAHAAHDKPSNAKRATRCITTPAGTVYNYDESGNVVSVGGMRPNHYDEWKQMMPEALQEKVEQIEENYTQMIAWRRKLEALTADPKSSKADISRAATLTRNYEAKNLNIFAQADACWEELCGRTVSDEVKKELAQEENRIAKEIAKEESAGSDASEPETDSDTTSVAPVAVSAEQAQKYIRDKFDPATASPEQIQKAKDYAEIILKENGKLSKKVQAKIDAIAESDNG